MTSTASLTETQQRELRELLAAAAKLIAGAREKLADGLDLSARDFDALSVATAHLQIAVEDFGPSEAK